MFDLKIILYLPNDKYSSHTMNFVLVTINLLIYKARKIYF